MADVFGTRLYRTPYLVLPRLALEAMTEEWQERFEAMLVEMDDTGMETPNYYVFRNDDLSPPGMVMNMSLHRGEYDPDKAYYVFKNRGIFGNSDPWGNYRRERVENLVPGFVRPAPKAEAQPEVAKPLLAQEIDPSERTEPLWEFRKPDGGVLRLVKWPEGLVFWADGVIVWKSWEKAT